MNIADVSSLATQELSPTLNTCTSISKKRNLVHAVHFKPDSGKNADLADLVSPISSKTPKRFKVSAENAYYETCFRTPANVESRTECVSPGHRIESFDGLSALLSPISELSNNFSDTSLSTPGRDGRAHDSSDQEQKSFTNKNDDSSTGNDRGNATGDAPTSPQIRFSQVPIKQSLQLKLEPDETCYSVRHTPASPAIRQVRNNAATHLNLCSPMHHSSSTAMVIDEELSFYDDEPQQSQSPPSSPSRMGLGLLLPEISPQRFHIVNKASLNVSNYRNKFLKPKTASNCVSSTTESSNSFSKTPAKGFRIFNSLSPGSVESCSVDDEYMELFEMESLDQEDGLMSLNFPTNLNSLISGRIKSSSLATDATIPVKQTPPLEIMRRPAARRCLSLTESLSYPRTPELVRQLAKETECITPVSARIVAESNKNSPSSFSGSCFKRPDPPSSTNSPVQSKRLRAIEQDLEKENLNDSYTKNPTTTSTSTIPTPPPKISRPTLRKSMSMNDAEIMCALSRSDNKNEPDLIGDFSKPFILPLVEGRHRDLKSISCDTMARLLRGEFDQQIASYKIIDCRYPYEYEGGHIRGATNLYTHEQIIEEFLSSKKTEEQQNQLQKFDLLSKRHIIIFHCEFSSERGPKLSRFLRNYDRSRNESTYPALHYPEIYLLHNGYKEFFETYADLCDPVAYRPMLEPTYNEAYRHFRAKSKSWNGGDVGIGGTMIRSKKSRSRLLL